MVGQAKLKPCVVKTICILQNLPVKHSSCFNFIRLGCTMASNNFEATVPEEENDKTLKHWSVQVNRGSEKERDFALGASMLVEGLG